MCGFIFIHSKYKNKNLKETALKMSKKLDIEVQMTRHPYPMTHFQ